MKFYKLYNKLVKEGLYSDDEDQEEELETVGIRGEYWFDDSGSAIYADGDIGDMNHEAYVIQQCAGEVASEFGADTDEPHLETDSPLEEQIIENIIDDLDIEDEKEKDKAIFNIKNDPASAMIDYLITNNNFTKDDANDLVLTAYGSMKDAREYAIKRWGWSRVHGDSIETKMLTRDSLKNIARGIHDALDQEGFHDSDEYTEEQIDNHEYDISTYSGKRYSIKLCDMEKGNVSDLEEEFTPAVTAATQQVRQMDIETMPDFYKKKGVIGDSVIY
jgi:hypothetical protein